MKTNILAYYLEDLWSKGFKLTDEEVRFIYFSKSSTNASEWMAKQALKVTLQIKFHFDGSFYLSLLELFVQQSVNNKYQIDKILSEKGIRSKVV